MAKEDIPVFREAQRGQVVRSSDWNTIQRELRHSIRTHRHTQDPDEPVDDASELDNALQIAADEIADGALATRHLQNGAVTGAKIAAGAVGLARLDPAVRGRLNGTAQVRTGVVTVAGGRAEQVEHKLGAVPVSILLGVVRELQEPAGAFEIYGSDPEQDRAPVFAAAPSKPDGTFFVISRSEGSLDVRWWVFAQTAEAEV
jgi:hypothetical protein